jgi:hypothetical protein
MLAVRFVGSADSPIIRAFFLPLFLLILFIGKELCPVGRKQVKIKEAIPINTNKIKIIKKQI